MVKLMIPGEKDKVKTIDETCENAKADNAAENDDTTKERGRS